MLTFSHCLRTKDAPKEVANAYGGESRGISVEIEVPLKVSGICFF